MEWSGVEWSGVEWSGVGINFSIWCHSVEQIYFKTNKDILFQELEKQLVIFPERGLLNPLQVILETLAPSRYSNVRSGMGEKRLGSGTFPRTGSVSGSRKHVHIRIREPRAVKLKLGIIKPPP